MSEAYTVTIQDPYETMATIYELHDRVQEHVEHGREDQRIWFILNHEEAPHHIRGRTEPLHYPRREDVSWDVDTPMAVRRIDGGKTFTHVNTNCFGVIEPVTGERGDPTHILDEMWEQERQQWNTDNGGVHSALPRLSRVERSGKQMLQDVLYATGEYEPGGLQVQGMDIYETSSDWRQVMGITYWKHDNVQMWRGCYFPTHPQDTDWDDEIAALMAADGYNTEQFYDSIASAQEFTAFIAEQMQPEQVSADSFSSENNREAAEALAHVTGEEPRGHCVLS